MTPIQLQDTILHAAGEPEAIFHPRDLVRFYLQHAEQFLGMARALPEATVSVPLLYNQSLYELHPLVSNFMYPLHVAINKTQLFPTTLSRVMDRDREWIQAIDFPREFYLVGSTHLGFYPSPPSSFLVARLTYIQLPALVPDTGTCTSGPEWHELLAEYVAAVLLAKEQKYDIAALKMQTFSDGVGMPRDVRFVAPAVKGDAAETPLHPTVEVHTG